MYVCINKFKFIKHSQRLFIFICNLALAMSITLALSGHSSILTANYFPPIELTDDYECCLTDFHSYNSIPNVDYDNNLFHIGDKVIEIPIGSYELQDIANYLITQYKVQDSKKSILIEANNNTLQIEITSSHDTIFFDQKRSIGRLLGYDGGSLEAGIKHLSNQPVNILKVNAIQVQCNIIRGAYMNNSPAHILHEFALDVPPGYKLDVIPSNLIYLPVNVKEITYLEIWIVDQEGRLINFRGEEVTLRLHLRPREK